MTERVGSLRKPSLRRKENSQLERDDFDAGPTNLDLIEPGIWLGNLSAATDVEVLSKHKINHILTIDSCPLPTKIIMLPGVKTKFIQVTDTPREDLVSHFEEASEFIKNAQEGGQILIHCYFGVSRSATIVIAYMMKKYQISLDEAFERVHAQRRFVRPNPGFMDQLRLYQNMGWCVDRHHLQFRMFRLHIAADQVKKVKILPQSCVDVIKPDPGLITVRPEPLVYRCRRCRMCFEKAFLPEEGCSMTAKTLATVPRTQRLLDSLVRVLASASNVLPHIPKEKPLWTDERWSRPDYTDLELCRDTYFVEPLAWMQSVTTSLQGKISCPKCNTKLGSFSWIMGCQCPCGSKISPAFYLVPSKVDWSNMVQNVQVTV